MPELVDVLMALVVYGVNTHSSPVTTIQYTTITSGGGSINFGE